ncbi:two-component system, NarL family, sensor histidine kinase LiaS [Lentibacillus persicus]|uniref:Sensor histidine kinase n=1 Tax=Lentibacillus persicus TaxID=640948 RepID=A0A1I1WK78_9BACI|nr:sensor histidine kinase [Lentibacillus persicus]SFD95462.1 two-component system, NarL family, sensor histidine kinase LiaS [Lentibacillus persicus]
MSPILRHVFAAILFSLLITLVMLGITFAVFPLNDWALIMESTLYDVPFFVLVPSVPIVAGAIIGITTGWYWRQRLQSVSRHLDEIEKGEKLSADDEPYKELDKVRRQMEQIQEKIRLQTENAQRLASERAEDREKSLQEIVVQERNRLARELHDSVSQQLFAASMMMSAINESNPPEDPSINKQLQMVEKMIHQSQLEMRALLLHLRPIALKGRSLQDGTRELLSELTQKVPMKIDSKLEEFPIDKGVEDQLFRIVQESVSNTFRHAKATSLNVMLIRRDEMIILRIADDGVGFDTENTRTSSYGLQNMHERASEIGGTFKVVSLPMEGTRTEVKVPALRKEGENVD